MVNDWIELVLALGALAAGGALEELLPKCFGVGFPFLFAATLHCAVRRRTAVAVLFAVAAGAMEDSLSSLPLFTSASAFVLATVAVRRLQLPLAACALAYPLYHLWLGVWITDLDGTVFLRTLMALPLGAVTTVAVALAMDGLGRKAGLDENG